MKSSTAELTTTDTILALACGKYKRVACVCNPAHAGTRFLSLTTSCTSATDKRREESWRIVARFGQARIAN